MKQLSILTTFLFCLFTLAAFGQIKTPQPSPVGKISQDVGLVKIDIEYSRPSAKGRKVFGDLVPFGEMWRTGANASTKVTFSENLKAGGKDLPKGSYALYTIPGENEWTIIFYKNTTFWGVPGSDFKDEDVAARFNVPAMKQAANVETFTMSVDNLKNSSADITLSWENTKVAIPLMLDTDAKVMADIKAQMEGPSQSTYYQSARYYFDEKKDMVKALEWINKALEKGEKFWMLRLKAQILAEMGQYKDAITTAERSTQLAKADGNTDYPRMNEKSIAEWKKK